MSPRQRQQQQQQQQEVPSPKTSSASSASSKKRSAESQSASAARPVKATKVVSAKDADSGRGEHFKPTLQPGQRDGTDINNPARVYMDGIFDMFHFGHARALQQGKESFQYVTLVVGCCSDEITLRLKGKTVMNEKERYESLRHCRWVDEVVEDAPWLVNQEFIDKHDIDFIAHGEDLSLDEHGNDVYAFAKSQGRFTTIKRTEGISTSDLILRIIRDYDSYLLRNLKRGYTKDDVGISAIKEQELLIKDKLRHQIDGVKARFNGANDTFRDFLTKFGPIPAWLEKRLKARRDSLENGASSE